MFLSKIISYFDNFFTTIERCRISFRILELKHQLRKLEGYYYQYFSNGLLLHGLTFDDIDPMDVPAKLIRSKQVQAVIDHIMSKAKEEKETCLEEGN